MTSTIVPPEPANRARGRLPDFFIVGQPKCGTTALYEMLKSHPDVFMSSLKEPRFFATDRWPLGGGAPETLEAYMALFEDARPDQRVGEASTSYLNSRAAAREIATVVPHARCIAILREPASFVRSYHLQLVQEQIENERDLATAVANEQITRRGRRVLRYSDKVRYVEQLKRFDAVFPSEQMLILIYDDFRRENEATVRRVLRFLEVDDTVALATVEANPSVSVRSVGLDRAIGSLYGREGPGTRVLKAAVGALLGQRAPGELLARFRRSVSYTRPEPIDEAFMRELRGRYRSEVLELSEYLGRDLVALWGYDELD